MRRLLPLVLLLAGCLAKHQPVQADRPALVASAAALAALDRPELEPVPPELSSAVAAELGARGLRDRPLDPATFLADWASRRATPHRLAFLAGQAPDAELLLLVECTVAFYSEMNGRYRWTVEVDATISPREDLTQAFSAHFQVPVFLDHYREREREALQAATPMVERRLGALLDAYLGGL